MKIIKNDKFDQVNEYGELIVHNKQDKEPILAWQLRFFKAMVIFLLITLTVIAIAYQ